jgi:hypothetical protein
LLVSIRGGQEQGGVWRVHWVLVKRIAPRLNFRRTVLGSFPLISAQIETAAKRGLQGTN